MSSVPRVRPGLLRHDMDDQILVYDPREDKVHLLNPTTACVLDLLQGGDWSEEKMRDEVARRMQIEPSAELVALALDELRKADLLDTSTAPVVRVSDPARREMLRKLGIAGAAALLIPVITTLTATPASAACTGLLPVGSNCNAGSQCCSGKCSCTPQPCQKTCQP